MGKLRHIKRGMAAHLKVCSCCGEAIGSETLDVEQYRPGPFARLSPADKARAADGPDVVLIPRGVGDFDTDTWYIRCVLYLPIQDAAPLQVGVGLWARVTPEEGLRYQKEFLHHRGVMMGSLDGEVPVQVKSKPGKGRPSLIVQDQADLSAWAEHLLKWQREGFPSLEEAHRFVKAFVSSDNSDMAPPEGLS